jgi:hypothetical protein
VIGYLYVLSSAKVFIDSPFFSPRLQWTLLNHALFRLFQPAYGSSNQT